MPKVIPGVQDKIVGAAVHLFSSTGYADVDMRSVAREAGVAVGTVYNYYPDKEALFLGVLEARYSSLNQELAEGMGDLPPGRARVFCLVSRLYDFIGAHMALWEGVVARGEVAVAAHASGRHSQVVKAAIEQLASQLAAARAAEPHGREGEEGDEGEEGNAGEGWLIRAAASLAATIATLVRQYSDDSDANLDFLRDMIDRLVLEPGGERGLTHV